MQAALRQAGCLPESLVGLLLGVGALGWPPGLGEDCREMKEGSLQRLPEPVPAEAASSGTDSSSRSRGREVEGEEGERREGEDEGEEGDGGEEEEWGEETEEEEAEAAAKSRGEGGVEAEPAAAEVGQLDVCLVGRWAAKDFLREMKGSRGVRVGGRPATCILPVPAARLPAPPRPGSHQASPCGFKAGPRPKDRLAALQDLQQCHADPVLTFCSLPHPHGLPHSQRVSTTGAPAVSITWDPPLSWGVGGGS